MNKNTLRNFMHVFGSVGLAFVAAACKRAESTNSLPTNSGGGLAEYVYYSCQTSTRHDTNEIRYTTSTFNNTSQEISVQIATSATQEIEFNDLKKTSNDQWQAISGLKVDLVHRKDGKKCINIYDPTLGRAVTAENSFCTLTCSGPTVFVNGSCLWSGKTEEDPYGNMVIDSVATLGLSGAFRLLALQGGKAAGTILASDPALRTGAELIAKSKNFDDAVVQMTRSLEKTNPLSGSALVGKGNCANDAITQLVSLVLGRWACAIPYPSGKVGYASVTRIADDLAQLVGIRQSHKSITNLTSFADDVLVKEMTNGNIAMVFSGAKNAGHATLIAKIKGQLVHINNQTWPKRFQTVAEWEETWRKSYGKDGAAYQVYIVSKKIIGFK